TTWTRSPILNLEVGLLQSLSVTLVHPGAQQPSPFAQAVTGECEQATSHVAGVPLNVSEVQELPSSQLVGQLPSHVSPGSSSPFPQLETHAFATQDLPAAQVPQE